MMRTCEYLMKGTWITVDVFTQIDAHIHIFQVNENTSLYPSDEHQTVCGQFGLKWSGEEGDGGWTGCVEVLGGGKRKTPNRESGTSRRMGVVWW